MLKIVLLPQPDGPIRLTKRPCGIDSVTGASAWKTPLGVLNAMLTWSTASLSGGRSCGCAPGDMHAPSAVPQHGVPPSPCELYYKKRASQPWRLVAPVRPGSARAGEPTDARLPAMLNLSATTRRAPSDHFAPESAALRIGDQRAISAFTKLSNLPASARPCRGSSRRARPAASAPRDRPAPCRAPRRACRSISFGVPLGAKMPAQMLIW